MVIFFIADDRPAPKKKSAGSGDAVVSTLTYYDFQKLNAA